MGTEKEKKEEREELYRKEKEKREEVYRKKKEKEKEEREELFWKKVRESNEEFQRILSKVRDRGMELAKGYESPMKKDVESDETRRDVTGESQGSTGPVRRKFRKFGLKKMERNMKEGKKVTLMTNML